MKRLTILWVFLWLVPAVAQQPKAPDEWAPFRFLVGTWTAEGHGQPGEGKGAFTFGLELQRKILVRRSHLAFPATPQRAAFAHDDLLVIYSAGDGASNRAVYFDSEGHAIYYSVAFSAGGKILTFLSDAGPQAPRQRLTYVQSDDATLKVKFEIAPPGKPDAFVTHVEGVAHREGKP